MPPPSTALAALSRLVAAIDVPGLGPSVDRARSDLAAAAWHASRRRGDAPIVALVGGTGVGKSSLVNRMLGVDVTATSFRRTFTAGPVAICAAELPSGFLALPHEIGTDRPPRGEAGKVIVVPLDHSLLKKMTLIDSPDVDGEFPEHHAIAERVFRWADAVVFVVTPEKYQMTELQPYYRLAQRYAVPTTYLMNKADNAAVVDDFTALLSRSGVTSPILLVVARDDSAWPVPAPLALTPERLATPLVPSSAGIRQRIQDATARVQDQLLQPLLALRQTADRTIGQLRAFAGDAVDVDVHPITQQLQRRMRERSILYLIGPQRILDRARTLPTTLVRLPRSMWDWARGGDFKFPEFDAAARGEPPDFRGLLVEQFQALQSRIDDVVQQSSALAGRPAVWKMSTDAAAVIADEEVGGLRQWLETRWNATPRDTALLMKLLKVIPGGRQLTKYSEAAPYLLAMACVAKGAVLGHVDLLVLGGYSAFTWLTEKINDEVAGRTRATNRNLAERYQVLAARQVEAAAAWLDTLAPPAVALERIATQLERVRTES